MIWWNKIFGRFFNKTKDSSLKDDYIEGVDFCIIPDTDPCQIYLLDNRYEGIILSFEHVAIEPMDDIAKLNFRYDIISNPNSYTIDVQEFECHIAGILLSWLLANAD